MGEPSSVPQLVPDHPLAVLGPLPRSLRDAPVDLEVVAEVAGGVDLGVVVAGLVAWPAGAVGRHLQCVCEVRRRCGHSYGRSHKKSRCPELYPLCSISIASICGIFSAAFANRLLVLTEPLYVTSTTDWLPTDPAKGFNGRRGRAKPLAETSVCAAPCYQLFSRGNPLAWRKLAWSLKTRYAYIVTSGRGATPS